MIGYILPALLFSGLFSIVAATPVTNIFDRAIGDACSGPEGKGTCIDKANCKGISYQQNFCPKDPDNIQCCVEIPCNVPAGSGYCRSESMNGCPGGSFHSGTGPPWPCPGGNDIKCCVKGGGGPPPGGVPARILAKAKEAAGLPYAWGGGNCQGPTRDQPPYQYGDIGFDCSGLVAWALCQVTSKDMFKAGLRVTHSMYCASDATLGKHGFKKVPYAQRQLGDAVFFGGACDCVKNRAGIHHVGLMMDSGDRMWNAPNDQINKVLELSIKGFGEKPCPNVVRFS